MATSKQSQQSTRRSAEMFPLIRKWERSNLNQKEFCALHDIKPHIFWYWLRRYRDQEHLASKEVPGFVSVEMEEVADEGVLAEVIYADGTRLMFKERVGLTFLQGLLSKK